MPPPTLRVARARSENGRGAAEESFPRGAWERGGQDVDPVEAWRDDRRAGDAEVDLLGAAPVADLVDERPHRGRADDAVLDQEHALALEHLGQRRVLEPGLRGAVGRPFDEGPPDVAVA